MSVISDYKNGVDTDITTKTTADSIPPSVVGGKFKDLADIVNTYGVFTQGFTVYQTDNPLNVNGYVVSPGDTFESFLRYVFIQIDPSLSNLVLSSGSLVPSYNKGTLSYTATVSNSVTSITVTPTASAPTTTITVQGVSVTSGSPSSAINLSVGSNTITVIGTNNSSTATYTLTVTRSQPVLASPSVGHSSVTQTGFTITIGSVTNATSYQTYINSSLIHTGPELTVNASGLTAGTTYTVNVVATASGYINSSPGIDNVTTTAIPPVTISWGYTTSDPSSDPSGVTLPFSLNQAPGLSSYSLDYTSATFAGDKYLVFKEPYTEPIKNTWFNTALNSGTSIPDSVYDTPVIIGSYRYYFTRNVAIVDSSTSVITYTT